AFPHANVTDRRIGLWGALFGRQPLHQSSAFAAVVTKPINVEREFGRRVGTDFDLELLTRFHAIAIAIAFNPRATNLVLLHPGIAQHPLRRSRLGILAANSLACGPNNGRSKSDGCCNRPCLSQEFSPVHLDQSPSTRVESVPHVSRESCKPSAWRPPEYKAAPD